ncbi:hypothetical protein RND81_05G231900 [Saponaria officinalis]|uniref:Centromere protein X n=1 Tax=Saponaria officinalis TaxID=3572 RepID=A0AAW1L1J1_SAPOF
MEDTFDADLIHAIFKLVWRRKALEREKNEGIDNLDIEGGAGTYKKVRPTSGGNCGNCGCFSAAAVTGAITVQIHMTNATAVKVSCELLRVFITEAIQRAATVAEAEGLTQIEGTHLERILPQLLLDF